MNKRAADEKQMRIINKNLAALLDKHKMNQLELSEIAGLSESAVSKWMSYANAPSMGSIQKIADYFGILKSDILEDKDVDFSSVPGIIPLHKARRIPVLGTIACGKPIWAEENFDGYFIADESIKADFCLKAKGDSMVDEGINDGDIAFFSKASTVDNGEVAAVLIENEATLKKFYKTDKGIILQSCNDSYEPIILRDEEAASVQVLGKLVGSYRKK